jgi:type IV pilus assembly protein PilM
MLTWIKRQGTAPIGVDVGTRFVKMVQFSGDRTRVLAAGRWEIPAPPAKSSPQEQAQRTAETLKRGLRERPFVGNDVVLCLSDKQLVLQNVRVPKVGGPELDRAVAQEIAGRVPFPVEETELRYVESVDVRQGDALVREVIVFACHRPVLAQLLEMVALAEMRPVAVDVEPAALARNYASQCRRGDDFKQRALVVHVGFARTAAVITQGDEMLFVKYIDVGGTQFDAAVARHVNMEPSEAAALRRSHGDRRSDLQDPEVVRSVTDATRPIVERLAQELAMCVRYHSVTFRGQPLARCVIGGGEASPQLAESLTRLLTLPCEVSDPFRLFPTGSHLGRKGTWDVAVGLALRDLN